MTDYGTAAAQDRIMCLPRRVATLHSAMRSGNCHVFEGAVAIRNIGENAVLSALTALARGISTSTGRKAGSVKFS
jgi:hypothetical protein